MTIFEPTEEVSQDWVQEVHASASRTDRRRRRKLSQAEALEIARLYAETNTPAAEIRERFGIGDSSLYRIVQQEGIALRGRTASATRPNAPRPQTPAARRRRSSSPNQAQDAVSQPSDTAAGTGKRLQFRIQFMAERVVRATDMRDALRQAESLGATEITAVSRED